MKACCRTLGLVFSSCLIVSLAFATSEDDFFTAIKNNDTSKLTTLLFRGMDPNTTTPSGQPGLVLAAREGSVKAAALLLSLHKTKVEARTMQDESALMLAALNGHEELVRLLISKGASINKTGWTALHYAATKGHVDIIKLLLDKSAVINSHSPNNSTPLMMAAMYGTTQAVKLLIDEGADVMLRNDLNLTALDFAKQANRVDAIVMLQKTMQAKQYEQTPKAFE